MSRVIGVALGVVVSLLLSPPAWAQGTTGGAGVTGTVKDASGAVLPGVTVEAASPALIEKIRTAVTDETGSYRIIELSPGTYTVTFTLTGFATFKREELELPSSFTATLNAELKVGGLEETITVSGQSPLIDVQNITRQASMSQTLLDTVPTSKSTFAIISLIPAAVAPTTQQDVGGSIGEASTRPSVHGAKTTDTRNLLDGLSYNNFSGNGSGRVLVINALSTQEIVVDTGSGGSAEYSSGGAVLNAISKDGANKFSGTLFATGSNDALQGNNLTDSLKTQGLTSANRSLNTYDINAVFAGPLIQDKLWFKTAHRRQGYGTQVGNLYYDANWNARVFGAPSAMWKYAPDQTRPVAALEDDLDHNVKLTWQAAPSHKINVTYTYGGVRGINNLGTLFSATVSPEANPSSNFRVTRAHFVQATWSHPATNKLLFEAGFNALWARTGFQVMNPDRINVRDTALNYTYNGVGARGTDLQYSTNQRFSMSYVTGAHNVKAGLLAVESFKSTLTASDRTTIPYTYTFNNGVPTQLTEFVSPLTQSSALKLSLGLFVQDQWQIRRMTLNYGLRYEYVNAYAPATDRPAGLLQDAATFAQVDCLPCWHDLNPRAGVSYDVFGTGKTALKASIGRYTNAMYTGLADTFRPITSAVNSTTRAWTDSNGDFYPDCDLRNPALNGECAAMANQSFGQLQVRTRPDPDWIIGFNKRSYQWSGSVSLDHELRPGVVVGGGYYRTWFGNFTVTDNLLVTPADYDPYCVTAPTDDRLPGNISGQQICGLYDLNPNGFNGTKPNLFGQVNNLVTLASKYGKQTEIYNGADLGVTIRLPRGAQVSGGWNIGNSVSLPAGTGFVSSRSNVCFVVDSPQQLAFPVDPNQTTTVVNGCETSQPYQNRVKVNGSYPLPWNLQAAVVYQNLPGAPYNALVTFTTAQILPTLGRNLAGGTRTVSVQLLPAYSAYLDQRVNEVDLRLSKILRLGRWRFQGNFDVYNVMNQSTVLQLNQAYGTTWLQPTQIIDARLFKLGVQVDF